MVADVHATTVDFEPSELKKSSLLTAASLIAAGVPDDIIFKQSCVPQHYELAIYLSHLASVGQMERMTQYKDKSEEKGVGFGLLSYPILMAADILSYNATTVPAGIDQHQHVQLAADLARKLNNKIGEDYLNIPKPKFTKNPKIMDILNPDKKMSKSSANQNGVLYLTDTIDIAVNKIKRATTDSKPYFTDGFDDQSDAIKNLIVIISELMEITTDDVCIQLQGKRYSDLKNMLISAYSEHIIPIKEQIDYMMNNNQSYINECIDAGSERAEKTSNSNVKIIRNKLGLGL